MDSSGKDDRDSAVGGVSTEQEEEEEKHKSEGPEEVKTKKKKSEDHEPGKYCPSLMSIPPEARIQIERQIAAIKGSFFFDRPLLSPETGFPDNVDEIIQQLADKDDETMDCSFAFEDCWSLEWSPNFICSMIYEGFLTICTDVGHGLYVLLPKMDRKRTMVKLTLPAPHRSTVPNSGEVSYMDRCKEERTEAISAKIKELKSDPTVLASGDINDNPDLIDKHPDMLKLKQARTDEERRIKKKMDDLKGGLYISRKLKKLSRKKQFFLSVNYDLNAFERVINGCVKQHGQPWLHGPMQGFLKSLFDVTMEIDPNNTDYSMTADERARLQTVFERQLYGVRLACVELWIEKEEEEKKEEKEEEKGKDEEDGSGLTSDEPLVVEGGGGDLPPALSSKYELIAGEIGTVVGSVFTSLSGYARKEKVNGCGMLQMTAMALLLRYTGYQIWDLGMFIHYKASLGAAQIPRSEFLESYRKFRRVTPEPLLVGSSTSTTATAAAAATDSSVSSSPTATTVGSTVDSGSVISDSFFTLGTLIPVRSLFELLNTT